MQQSLQGVVVNTIVFAATPVAENTAAPAEAGGVNFTPAERDEIIALTARLMEIDRQLAENAAARAELQRQIDPLTAVLSGLRADLAQASAEFDAAVVAFNDFVRANRERLNEPAVSAEYIRLVRVAEGARGRMEAFERSIARVESAIDDIQGRINALFEHDGYLRDIRYNIDYRIRVIIDRARAGLPNSGPVWFPDLPARFAPRTADSEF